MGNWNDPFTVGELAMVLGFAILLELAVCLGLLWGFQ